MRKYFIIYIMLSCLPMVVRGQTNTDADLSELLPTPVQAQSLHYWYDTDTENLHTASGLSGSYYLDVSSLPDGLHTIHYEVIGSDNKSSSLASEIFLKMTKSIGESAHGVNVAAVKLQYWYDTDIDNIQIVSNLSGIYTLNVAELADGLHTIHYQVVGSDGKGYGIASEVFLKMANIIYEPTFNPAPIAKKVKFWFNTDISSAVLTDAVSGFQTVDVSALPEGLHSLHYQLVYADGGVGPTSTSIFLKPITEFAQGGPNTITKYLYWLNGNNSTVKTVEVKQPSNPYQLITLLPIQEMPFRSSFFHFEFENGNPCIYAQNNLQIRFYDAKGYFVDDYSKSYIDYKVKQTVEPEGVLLNTQTFDRVAQNKIRWYTLQAAPGDTVAFKSSQASTIQLFAPSGKEIFKSSESTSVEWAGIHTWEEGTYYLAVHDVTGTRPTMTLDYMHMDKYDVVEWDVHTVGNGGCSTITFKGNGFGDLYAVDLYTAEGDTIHSVDVSHDSDAETAVTFDFSGAELGVYDAVFHFTEEDKIVSEAVTVEEAVDIELATNVSFPSTFLRGTSTTYTIRITNKGNMTAYAVPLDIRLRVPTINEISIVLFGGNLKTISIPTDISSNDSIDIEVLSILREEFRNANDISQFVFYRDSIEKMDYGLSQNIIDIPPYSTETFIITITPKANSSSPIYLDAVASKDWLPLTLTRSDAVKMKKARRKIPKEELCCNRTKIECVADAMANITGFFMPPGANCATSIVLTGIETAFDIWCTDGNSSQERFEKYLQSQGKSLAKRLIQSAVSCVTFFFNQRLKSLREDRIMAAKLGNTAEVERITQEMNGIRELMRNTIKSIYEGIVSIAIGEDCIEAFTKPIPNCPPDPDGGGGTSTPVPPVDPNDIYGYLSEAGSKFIADSVARVHYTIEFENDTAFAQASAHTIVIKDTLDSKVFDLKAFVPTGVKLGGREVFLDEADVVTKSGVTSFVKTIDVRPEINAIAQVEGTYSQQTGIAEWRFTSLDPMTMEPTDDIMQGILPVNYDGTSGIGEVMFEVGVKSGKADGSEVANRAGIVFDYEEAILTPTWVNTVDAVAPTSSIAGGIQRTDSTLILRLSGEDNRSGVWKYAVYAQAGSEASWELVAENVTDTLCKVRVLDGIDYGFCVLATDSAGNVERKTLAREFELATYLPGDANGDGTVNSTDAQLVVNYYLGKAVYLNFAAADVVADGQLNSVDAQAIQNIYLNSTQARKLMPRRARPRKAKAAGSTNQSN